MTPAKHVVVTQDVARLAQLKMRTFVSLVVVTLVSLFAAVFVGGYACGKSRTEERILKIMDEVVEVRRQQTKATEYFERAWTEQREGIKLIVSWAEYVRTRQEISEENRKDAPQRVSR